MIFFLFSLFMLGQDQRDFTVGSNPSLELANISGNIEVRVGESGLIQVQYEKQNDDIQVTMDQDGDRVWVKVEYPHRGYNRGGVNFKVTLPPETEVDIKSVSGNINASGLARGGELESVSGHVRLNDSQGDFEVSSVSGDVEVHKARGSYRLGTVSGSVEIDDMDNATLKAESVSGNLRLSSTNLAGEYSFETTSGNIAITHNRSASYRVRCETFSGHIDYPSEADMTLKKDQYTPSKSLKGNYQGGKGLVEAETLSGSIRIVSR